MNNLVVSSRVRLARNIKKLPFKTDTVDAHESVAQTIRAANPTFRYVRIDQLADSFAKALYEQHLISKELLENKRNGMIVTRDEPDTTGRVCVMLGEEDHIRIQVIEVGLDLQKAHATATKIATDIATKHDIARDDKLGYLTSCPTNLGTGMRASVMMFLPALTLTGRINGVIHQLRPHRITVRGVYGEGSEASGYMYQISNQACLGLTENEIITREIGRASCRERV